MISITIIDYIGVLESEYGNGVAVILSLLLNDKQYEMIYWFNNHNDFTISLDDNFFIDYPNIKNIYEYEYLIDLIFHIDTYVLPPREEIFKEFDLQ